MQGLIAETAIASSTKSATPGGSFSIGYLGGKSDHWENITRLMASVDKPVVALPTSTSSPEFRHTPGVLSWKPASTLHRKGTRILGQLHGTRNGNYVRTVLELIDTHGLDCVVAYWSTEMLGDLMAIKKLRPRVKLILNLLCHPMGLSKMKVRLQNWHFRRSVGCLDGLIMPSQTMRGYLEKNVLRGRNMPILIWPPFYSQHFFPKHRSAPCELTPNLLFLGRMDFYRAQPSDDVRGFIEELLDRGVHVYHCEAKGYAPRPNRHTFTYLPLPQAEEFATAFDASLILYNLKACRKKDRFEATVFDRLVASVTAGIPIAIPAEGYAASKEYLREYPAVIEFASADDLAKRLGDRPAMARMRIVAAEKSAGYIGERRLNPLIDFVQCIVAQ